MKDSRMNYFLRVLADFIAELGENEVLVLGSNLGGMHGGEDAIKSYEDDFVMYAKELFKLKFLVT